MTLSIEIQLCVLKDRPVYVDVGEQEEMLDFLSAYEPSWLTLVLLSQLNQVHNEIGRTILHTQKHIRLVYHTSYLHLEASHLL